jgi:hypothetical protein
MVNPNDKLARILMDSRNDSGKFNSIVNPVTLRINLLEGFRKGGCMVPGIDDIVPHACDNLSNNVVEQGPGWKELCSGGRLTALIECAFISISVIMPATWPSR